MTSMKQRDIQAIIYCCEKIDCISTDDASFVRRMEQIIIHNNKPIGPLQRFRLHDLADWIDANLNHDLDRDEGEEPMPKNDDDHDLDRARARRCDAMNLLMGYDECECCGGPASVTILLADMDDGYFYIPNQHVRSVQGTEVDNVKQVPFCAPCMRTVEDQLRATIAKLKAASHTPRPHARRHGDHGDQRL